MASANGIVSLLTDFGTADTYVGMVKAVILSRAPRVRLVDLSHEVPPQDVARAAFLLATAVPYYPPGTVHLVVVDPGVGTSRRPVAVATERAFFVGPDNGLFTYATTQDPVRGMVELRNPDHRLTDVSYTFHARDIFAPAAAHLASGGRLSDLGPPVTNLVRLPPLYLQREGTIIRGQVLYADRFGNIITTIGPLRWEGDYLLLTNAAGGDRLRFAAASAAVRIAERELRPIHHTYAEVAPGTLLAFVSSHRQLEVAVNGGNAARTLGLQPGDAVVLEYVP